MSFMNRPRGTPLKAIYKHLDCLLGGVEKLKDAKMSGYEVLSPLPRHEILEVVYEGRPSPVRWWTMTGAIIGVTAGFLLTSMTHAQWPMINPGGKPVVSLVPFAVIMFECTILFGSLANFLGMIVHSGLPSFGLSPAMRDPRLSDDCFGIVFPNASDEELVQARAILESTGAVEVTQGEDTIYEVHHA